MSVPSTAVPGPLSDWASEVATVYRNARRIAFPLGVLASGFAAMWFEWPAGWVIAGVLALVSVRVFLAPLGSILIDTAIDAIALGIVTLFLEVPASWIVLAFPLAVVVSSGKRTPTLIVAAITLFFGLSPRVAPEVFLLGQAEWVPSVLRTSTSPAGGSQALTTNVMVTFLLLVIAVFSFRMRRLEGQRTQLLAETAHDLRNSVGAIQGLASVLDEEDLPEASHELTAAIASTAAETLQLSNDILALARFQMRQGDTKEFRLDELARQVARATPDVEVESTPVTVRADEGRTAQVIRNLIGNAIAHGGPPVTVRVHCTPATAFVSVTDAGAGIPPETERSVFTGSRQVGEGMGIGLATSLSFAGGMGGRISYHRADGLTAFEFAIPRAE
ncbi:MAG: HAMP domain-containing histidine kinase [Acidimicrobiia bacterium]|nr:HAMP domain-containing histidine kinase [Acidimicrobiia bacterium]